MDRVKLDFFSKKKFAAMLKEVSWLEIRLRKGSVNNVSLREVGLSEVDGGRFDRGQWIAVSLLEMSLMEI